MQKSDLKEQRWEALKEARDFSESLGDFQIEQVISDLLHLISEPRLKKNRKIEQYSFLEKTDTEHFILKLNSNDHPNHIKAYRDAIITYAISIEEHSPELSKELIDRYII